MNIVLNGKDCPRCEGILEKNEQEECYECHNCGYIYCGEEEK